MRTCRKCGCTERNACVGLKDGIVTPCHWVELDLCSACVREVRVGYNLDIRVRGEQIAPGLVTLSFNSEPRILEGSIDCPIEAVGPHFEVLYLTYLLNNYRELGKLLHRGNPKLRGGRRMLRAARKRWKRAIWRQRRDLKKALNNRTRELLREGDALVARAALGSGFSAAEKSLEAK
jgi:hypothetical protein